MIELRATFLDGKTSQARDVKLRVLNHSIVIVDGDERTLAQGQYRAMIPTKNGPLIIELVDGGRLEVESGYYHFEQIRNLFTSGSRFVYWLESHSLGVVLSLISVVLGLVFLVQVVLPKLSGSLAARVPQEWANSFDKILVEQLDSKYFSPSKLSPERQQQLTDYLREHIDPRIKILFRELELPNAFALAGNTIIIGDELVEAMSQDEEILSVVFHEEAHLKNRHVLSTIFSSSVLSGVSFFIIGDMVGTTDTILNMGVFLVSAKYSRKFEQQADQGAYASLKRTGLSSSCFKQALLDLEKAYKMSTNPKNKLFNYLSSHPQTTERVAGVKDEVCKPLK